MQINNNLDKETLKNVIYESILPWFKFKTRLSSNKTKKHRKAKQLCEKPF